MSSAMAREVFGRDVVDDMVEATGEAVRERVGFGANADATATMTARRRMESLAILDGF